MNGGPSSLRLGFEGEPTPEALARLRAALRLSLDAQPGPLSECEAAAEEPAPTPAPSGAAPESRDPLPEHATYRDTGCHVSPSCLRCPLAVCIYDQEPEPRRQARRERDRRLRAMAAQGWSAERLAQYFGLSPSQVRRIRARPA